MISSVTVHGNHYACSCNSETLNKWGILTGCWSICVRVCRHRGYSNLEYMQQVVNNYTAADLPLETIWSDIDYMHNRFRNAEFDPLRYPVNQMSSYVEELNARGQHWIPILDAGVAAAPGYLAYEEGNKQDVWIKDYSGKEAYVGQVRGLQFVKY